ncbi:MAG: FixH family protein [Brumimicrobium sp.]
MNWGKGITIFLILFIGFISTLAVILMKANTDLVSEDYYKKEIVYGQEIIAEKNAIKNNSKLEIESSEDGLFIQVISDETPEKIQIYLLRGNNNLHDVEMESEGSAIFIKSEELIKGKYKLTVNWFVEDQPFQMKEDIWVK